MSYQAGSPIRQALVGQLGPRGVSGSATHRPSGPAGDDAPVTWAPPLSVAGSRQAELEIWMITRATPMTSGNLQVSILFLFWAMYPLVI